MAQPMTEERWAKEKATWTLYPTITYEWRDEWSNSKQKMVHRKVRVFKDRSGSVETEKAVYCHNGTTYKKSSGWINSHQEILR